MTKPALSTPYTLELCFDADQVTEALQYRVLDTTQKQINPLVHGRLAGTFNFDQGTLINVKVIGIFSDEKKRPPKDISLSVTNCTLVSIKPPVDQDLSLFDPYNATTVISEWSPIETTEDPNTKLPIITTQALSPLHVTANEGQWKISGYLSVIFTEGTKEYSRLYYFDPEGSAGNGGIIPS